MIHPLLTRSLQANALFSGLSGLLMVVLSDFLARWLGGWPQWLMLILGLGLILFAVDVALMGWRRWRLEATPLIITMDGLWVLGSIGLLVLKPEWVSTQGHTAILAVAAMVFVLGSLQLQGWVRSTV